MPSIEHTTTPPAAARAGVITRTAATWTHDMATTPTTTTGTLAWEQIATLEPALAGIIAEAAAIKSPWWDDYSRLKGRLSELVGFGARNPRLRSCVAYDLAIDKMVEALGL